MAFLSASNRLLGWRYTFTVAFTMESHPFWKSKNLRLLINPYCLSPTHLLTFASCFLKLWIIYGVEISVCESSKGLLDNIWWNFPGGSFELMNLVQKMLQHIWFIDNNFSLLPCTYVLKRFSSIGLIYRFIIGKNLFEFHFLGSSISYNSYL